MNYYFVCNHYKIISEIISLFSFFKIYFIDYAITVVPFPLFTPLHPAHPLPPTFPPYSSCPWVILIRPHLKQKQEQTSQTTRTGIEP